MESDSKKKIYKTLKIKKATYSKIGKNIYFKTNKSVKTIKLKNGFDPKK